MAESFWDNEQAVAEIKKNERGEVISVKLVTKSNRQFIDVRNFYVNKEGDLAPAKGIALPIDLAVEVAEQILAAVKQADRG
jgi:hypothetical protein